MRHKRQALQDMARPLKQWLYKHRDNPYPTKTEKILLALGSQMTLVQVSPICGSNQMQKEEKSENMCTKSSCTEQSEICPLWLESCH